MTAAATDKGGETGAAATDEAEDTDHEEEEGDDHTENPNPGFEATVLAVLVAVVSHSVLSGSSSLHSSGGVSISIVRN